MAAERTLYAKENRRLRADESVDVPFLGMILTLLALGLAVLYSASYAQSEFDTGYTVSTRYLQKQAVCAALGLVGMAAFSRIPAEVWYRLAWPLYGVSIALLLAVLAVERKSTAPADGSIWRGSGFSPRKLRNFP